MEKRTIRITGVGSASAKVDLIVISMVIRVTKFEYLDAMTEAGDLLDDLRAALAKVGFEKEELKTTSFSVDKKQNYVTDKKGNSKWVFVGYTVVNRLTLSLDFDMKRLASTLGAIARSEAHPEFDITFTVKDTDALKLAILKDAGENAKRKAAALCEAAGATLGDVISIDYSWAEITVRSRTRYSMDADACMIAPSSAAEVEIEPEDVKAGDTATFVWEIR